MNKIIKNIPTFKEGFLNVEGIFCDIPAILVVPAKSGGMWNKYNLDFRSIILNKQTSEVISIGFKKFHNLGESPDLYPDPSEFQDRYMEEKLDGSTCIFDYIGKELSIRTRGSFSYKGQENYLDFEQIYGLYPKFIEYVKLNPHCSFVAEIVTPNNIIVKKYNKVDFYLIGMRSKVNLEYASKEYLDAVSQVTGMPRPKVYDFNSIKEAHESVVLWKNEEGIVLNYDCNQNRIKLKSDWYCTCHRFVSKIANEENLIDLFLELDCPKYDELFKYISDTFDWEIAKSFQAELSKICDAWKSCLRIIGGFKVFVEKISDLGTRREQAEKILSSYGETGKAGMVFSILDGKQLQNKDKKRLLFQVLKYKK